LISDKKIKLKRNPVHTATWKGANPGVVIASGESAAVFIFPDIVLASLLRSRVKLDLVHERFQIPLNAACAFFVAINRA
jgi:hypothetical protein